MATQQDSLSEFRTSVDQGDEFPLNLVRTDEFPYSLNALRSKLDLDKNELFGPKSDIVIWDLAQINDGYRRDTVHDVKALRSTLTSGADPLRRFIFLCSASSRNPLKCSKDELVLILSHHQIMASFLDFVFTFRNRELPHSSTSFRHENYLSSHHRQPGLSSLGRSGILIQHCFNVLGIEFDKRTGNYLQRQIAAYHSFDFVEGRALWVVMKGNATAQKRIQEATEASLKKHPGSLESISGSFRQSLVDHLIILQWCVENWAAYSEYFEKECRPFLAITGFSQIEQMADDIQAIRKGDRIASLPTEPPPRSATGLSQTVLPPLRRMTSRLHSWRRSSSWLSNSSVPERKVKDMRLDSLANFESLQSMCRLDKELDEAVSVIDKNKKILSEIKTHYQSIMDSDAFNALTDNGIDLKQCKQHTADFIQQIERLESDLDNHQGQFKTLLRSVEKAITAVNGIFQLGSMRTAEYFAKSAEESTLLMETYTKQMHTKTMSMHVITVFTLIFLPGTFVATVFSSGILTFGEDSSAGFGPNLGDWKVRLAGLKLYFAVCIPLMALTLCVWIAAYCFAGTRRDGLPFGPPGREKDLPGNEKATMV